MRETIFQNAAISTLLHTCSSKEIPTVGKQKQVLHIRSMKYHKFSLMFYILSGNSNKMSNYSFYRNELDHRISIAPITIFGFKRKLDALLKSLLRRKIPQQACEFKHSNSFLLLLVPLPCLDILIEDCQCSSISRHRHGVQRRIEFFL